MRKKPWKVSSWDFIFERENKNDLRHGGEKTFAKGGSPIACLLNSFWWEQKTICGFELECVAALCRALLHPQLGVEPEGRGAESGFSSAAFWVNFFYHNLKNAQNQKCQEIQKVENKRLETIFRWKKNLKRKVALVQAAQKSCFQGRPQTIRQMDIAEWCFLFFSIFILRNCGLSSELWAFTSLCTGFNKQGHAPIRSERVTHCAQKSWWNLNPLPRWDYGLSNIGHRWSDWTDMMLHNDRYDGQH